MGHEPVEHPEVPAGRPTGPPPGPRDPGDGWAYGPDGQKAWGTVGAAGLLVADDAGRVLLQHRVEWSHYGGTWGIPGGARHVGEDAVTGALRESAEEAAVPAAALQLRHTSVVDLGYWSYTTVVARAATAFAPEIGDRESLSLEWVPADAVEDLLLHPGFGRSWPGLRAVLDARPVVVVDAANVVGSVPDGWWRDRAAAADRLLTRVSALATGGLSSDALDLPFTTWWPSWTVVLEGDARAAADPGPAQGPAGSVGASLSVVRAPASGDDAIVAEASRVVGSGASPVVVVTADRELRERAEAVGAVVRGPSWLRDPS
ncbi:NUDIX domain-containing protein [Curtobacterium sp. Leaf261]|uniref:NUDIX domain-containing protein n=1 Tax=Curtobacterium sp. Leaf261 TaxID=1736311 RepID=UPI0006F8CF59|nr:NUDIX domain-containing protein [Curtobacterium sp. Leaf261]KQO65102.1 NTP pyrophosphohydrolase [Curtobacterium sp. Leaf261]